jgi:type VI protein secretion system component Hcp
MKIRTVRLTTWVGLLAFVSFALLARQSSASSIVFTLALSTGETADAGSILSFTPNGTGGTISHTIDSLSPQLANYTASGTTIASASLIEYDGAISPALELGEYDFTSLIFSGVSQNGTQEEVSFQSASSTFSPGPSCASQHNFTFSLSTGESDSIHSFSFNGSATTFSHDIDSFSPQLSQYTATGTHFPSAAIGVYDCAILPTLKTGEYDFTDLFFTGISNFGTSENVSFQSASTTFTPVGPAPVPEPASLTLLGLGLAGMGAKRWRQRKA